MRNAPLNNDFEQNLLLQIEKYTHSLEQDGSSMQAVQSLTKDICHVTGDVTQILKHGSDNANILAEARDNLLDACIQRFFLRQVHFPNAGGENAEMGMWHATLFALQPATQGDSQDNIMKFNRVAGKWNEQHVLINTAKFFDVCDKNEAAHLTDFGQSIVNRLAVRLGIEKYVNTSKHPRKSAEDLAALEDANVAYLPAYQTLD